MDGVLSPGSSNRTTPPSTTGAAAKNAGDGRSPTRRPSTTEDTGTNPMATSVPTATPMSRAERKNSGW